jgi:hypothetical protein
MITLDYPKVTYQAPLLRRHEDNPILSPGDMPFPCSSVFNCGAARYKDEVLLLLRVEDMARDNIFYTATSPDGVHFTISPTPISYPLRDTEKRFLDNRFDMRITPLDDTFYVTHASWLGGYGSCIGIAQTDDFENFRAVGELSVPSNRNAALFPEKINGHRRDGAHLGQLFPGSPLLGTGEADHAAEDALECREEWCGSDSDQDRARLALRVPRDREELRDGELLSRRDAAGLGET